MLTFTSTVQPIVWEGRAMGEPLTIRWTKEDFPTPARMRKYHISAIKMSLKNGNRENNKVGGRASSHMLGK
jgi:hypothetical protein